MNKFSSIIVSTFILAIVLGAASVREARAQGVLNEILNTMEAHKNSLQSLQADVKMAKTNTQLGITDTQVGEVFYLPAKGRNAYVRINWTEPEEILAVANGKYLLYRPRLNQAIRGKVDGNKNTKATGALSFMSMSKSDLKKNFEVQYLGKVSLGGSDVWHLGLKPKTKQSYKEAELWVDGNGMPVQAKIVEVNRDVTTVRLSDLKKNVTIKGSIFAYKPPAGTKFIDG